MFHVLVNVTSSQAKTECMYLLCVFIYYYGQSWLWLFVELPEMYRLKCAGAFRRTYIPQFTKHWKVKVGKMLNFMAQTGELVTLEVRWTDSQLTR